VVVQAVGRTDQGKPISLGWAHLNQEWKREWFQPAVDRIKSAQPQHDHHTFDGYWLKARQRGREAVQAVAAEYPDATLFCYFMNSINATATGQPDPRRVLRSQGYGLYPAFIDGWLDAATSRVAQQVARGPALGRHCFFGRG
jgi:hypothetical protein